MVVIWLSILILISSVKAQLEQYSSSMLTKPDEGSYRLISMPGNYQHPRQNSNREKPTRTHRDWGDSCSLNNKVPRRTNQRTHGPSTSYDDPHSWNSLEYLRHRNAEYAVPMEIRGAKRPTDVNSGNRLPERLPSPSDGRHYNQLKDQRNTATNKQFYNTVRPPHMKTASFRHRNDAFPKIRKQYKTDPLEENDGEYECEGSRSTDPEEGPVPIPPPTPDLTTAAAAPATPAPYDIGDIIVPASFVRIEYMISFTFLGLMYGLGFLVLFQSLIVPAAKLSVAIVYYMLLTAERIQPFTLQDALEQINVN